MPIMIDLPFPETCAKCPMFEYGALSNCKLLKKPILWYEANTSRDGDCPLIEVKTPQKGDIDLLEASGFEL